MRKKKMNTLLILKVKSFLKNNSYFITREMFFVFLLYADRNKLKTIHFISFRICLSGNLSNNIHSYYLNAIIFPLELFHICVYAY